MWIHNGTWEANNHRNIAGTYWKKTCDLKLEMKEKKITTRPRTSSRKASALSAAECRIISVIDASLASGTHEMRAFVFPD